ncbi:MAG: endolytic transglycosylase MltG [Clostridium sp.]|nr:endolytic transglycosylase MltG [Clostridium sp.]
MNKKTITKKKKSKKSKNRFLAFLLYFTAFLLIFTLSSYFSYKYFIQEKELDVVAIKARINEETGIHIEIPIGSNTSDIAAILNDAGVVDKPLWFKFISKFNGYDGCYKSGKHIIDKALGYREIMEILCDNPITTTVTIVEGKNLKQIAHILDEKNLIDMDIFLEACGTEEFEYKFLEGVPDRKNKLEGYLFPDTYFFDPTSGPRSLIKKFLDNFNLKFKEDFYTRAKELNMSIDEIIILASIIEAETPNPDERPIVSSVFHNRLKSENPELKKLQSCATVQYVLYDTQNKMKEKISDNDTKIEHPYNTYLYEGLPPGPICSPGIAAIEAALYPDEESTYFYFVAKGDGTHHFSKTLEEHMRASETYQSE